MQSHFWLLKTRCNYCFYNIMFSINEVCACWSDSRRLRGISRYRFIPNSVCAKQINITLWGLTASSTASDQRSDSCCTPWFLKADMILCLAKQFLEASRQNKRAEFTESRKSFTPNTWAEHEGCKVKQKMIWRDFIDCRFNVCLIDKKREREIRINPLSYLFGNLI